MLSSKDCDCTEDGLLVGEEGWSRKQATDIFGREAVSGMAGSAMIACQINRYCRMTGYVHVPSLISSRDRGYVSLMGSALGL